jgi:WD40 repeat protein
MYQEFSILLQERTEVMVPLTVEELERSIRAPAERAGVLVEAALVATIISDMVDRPGTLPLLQFALTELFERRSGRKLTLDSYQSIGGVRGVLERQAEETYARLSAVGKESARQVFLRLVSVGEGPAAYDLPVYNTRKRVLRSELEAVALGLIKTPSGFSEKVEEVHNAIQEVIEAFGEARLLSFDREPFANRPTVEITHEALLREWPRLSGWLEEDRGDVLIQRALSNAAVDWLKAGQDSSFLLHGARLSYFEDWASETNLALTGEELTYLNASLAEREELRIADEARQNREAALEQRSRNFLRTLVVVLLLAVILSLALTGIVRREQTLATSRELAAMGVNSLETDPELSILLSLQALRAAYTREAEDALHRAVQTSRVRLVLSGHEGGARSVDFSPDGKTIATASQQGEVRLWDSYNGQFLYSLPGRIARYSPDGEHIATGNEDGTVTVWNFSTQSRVWMVNGHRGLVSDLLFSTNSRLLVSTSLDDTFIVWDTNTGEKIFSSRATVSGVETRSNVAFSPDGTLLIAVDVTGDTTGASTGWVRVWRVGQSWDLIKEYRSNVRNFSISAGGQWLALPGGRLMEGIYLRYTSAMIGDKIASAIPIQIRPLTVPAAHEGGITDLAFTSDQAILATASQDSTAKIWRISREGVEPLLTLSGHSDPILDIDLNPDESLLATASLDGTVRIWDITPSGASEWFTLAAHSDAIYHLGLTSDGKYMLTSSLDGTAKVWDLASGIELVSIREDDVPFVGIDISSDGKLLATADSRNTVKIWRLDLLASPASVDIMHTITGHTIAQSIVNLLPGLNTVAFSPDNKKLATGGVNGLVKIWDVETGMEDLSVDADTNGNGMINLTFSPDGKYLATVSDDIKSNSVVKIWDAIIEDEIFTLTGRTTGRIFDVAISSDGTLMATGGETGALKLWDLKTGGERLSLKAHNAAIVSIDFTSDGKHMITGSLDGTARVWDILTGEIRRVYTSPRGPYFEASFSVDEKNVIISGDGFVYGLILDLDDLIRLAQSRLTRWFTPEECRQYLHLSVCPPQI